MTFSLPKRTRLLWQLRICIAFAIICASVAFFSRYTLWFSFSTVVIAIFGLAIAFLYVPFYFKSFKIWVGKNSICISKGVIIKTTYIMPYARFVFAQSFATPLSSMMRMKCIMIKAARSWMIIPEIEDIDAEYLLNNLRAK